MIRNIAVQEGTFVNGQRIETVDLHDGDRINIGGYEMMFHLRGTSTQARHQASLATDARRVPVVDQAGALIGVVAVTEDLAGFCGTS